ncbi:MAG TPA: 4a-hydroxytetrahydrobiopterin dehydratase [Flavobacterium sp.]|jgi:4a-hydroxytetrahydrobiopterin dehydratase|nr:4a-hydroxytetrahydrobiopterin dehydratase [Flavobacterium sp.]
MKTFDETTIITELEQLKDWNFTNNAIEKKYVFKDFKQALGFIVQVGVLSEKRNHHPELFNVYNKVTLRLNTHTENSVTMKDIELAIDIDEL